MMLDSLLGCYLIPVPTDIYLKRRILMEKVSTLGCFNKDQKCSFCCSPSGEIRVILKVVLRQLGNMLKESRYADMPPSTQENNGAIGRLIRVIFGQQQFELRLSKDCPHTILRR